MDDEDDEEDKVEEFVEDDISRAEEMKEEESINFHPS